MNLRVSNPHYGAQSDMVHSGIATYKGDRDRRAQTKSAIDVVSAVENLSKHKGELYLGGVAGLRETGGGVWRRIGWWHPHLPAPRIKGSESYPLGRGEPSRQIEVPVKSTENGRVMWFACFNAPWKKGT
ncbi:MAG: hypothetical protein VB853_08550 [Pirellulales bacterium]